MERFAGSMPAAQRRRQLRAQHQLHAMYAQWLRHVDVQLKSVPEEIVIEDVEFMPP